jgi:hypothetical protein
VDGRRLATSGRASRSGKGSDQPELHCIQHPAAHFREGEDIFATGFIIHEEVWRERSRDD